MRIRVKTTIPALLLTLVLAAASTIYPILGSPNDVSPEAGITATSPGLPSINVAPGACGPIDLTIALDDTGSMGGAISNIIAELPTIISTATTASGGDLRAGYMTFKDSVTVHNNLTTNISAVTDSINATFASGGAGGPESSDEAKNTSVNNLPAGTRPDAAGNLGTQTGNYTTPYRANATKIVVLITDAPPGGFNDIQDAADNIALNTTHPLAALANGIKVSDVFVPTGGDYAGQAALLAEDANVTGGAFITTAANGTGTGAAITAIIEACGGVTPPVMIGNVTGGGWIVSPTTGASMKNNRATFGFVAHYVDGMSMPSGNLQYMDHVSGMNVHGNVTTLTVNKTAMTAMFTGTATIDGAGSYAYTADVHDGGEPGKIVDHFSISIPGFMGGYSASDMLMGGNIQLHDP